MNKSLFNFIKQFSQVLMLCSSLMLVGIGTARAMVTAPPSPYGEHESLATAEEVQNPSEMRMATDILIARPLLFMATVAGTGLFVVSLPFSAIGGNADAAAQELVVKPAKATFARCLGCVPADKQTTTF